MRNYFWMHFKCAVASHMKFVFHLNFLWTRKQRYLDNQRKLASNCLTHKCKTFTCLMKKEQEEEISRLPVQLHPSPQNVRNSAKSVLLAAKAIVNVAHYCCGATHQLDAEGWDTPALFPPIYRWECFISVSFISVNLHININVLLDDCKLKQVLSNHKMLWSRKVERDQSAVYIH